MKSLDPLQIILPLAWSNEQGNIYTGHIGRTDWWFYIWRNGGRQYRFPVPISFVPVQNLSWLSREVSSWVGMRVKIDPDAP